MNVLQDSNMNVINFLGGFQRRYKYKNYRWNKFIIETEYSGESILYNGLTGSVVTLRPFEYENVFTELPCDYSNFLFDNYFLVPDNFNETKIVKDYRARHETYINPNYLEVPTHFTILTTTKCNARCPYCYENNMSAKHDMTKDTARDVVKYIVEHANKNAPLTFEWFGGEPLTNTDVIDIITSSVVSAGFEFSSRMVSNGYLLNRDLIQKAASLWRVSEMQITLDGYGETYNKTKRYIYKDDPNPFETVIKNIHTLLEFNIGVSIRLNCGTHNYKNLIELIEYLSVEFKDQPGLSVYSWEIFSETKRDEDKAEIFFDCLDKVDEAICNSGLQTPNYLEHGIKSRHCMVDSGSGTIIEVDGNMCLCEHYLENDFYGDIYHHGEFDDSVIKAWRGYVNTYEGICSDCPNQAGCLKMSRCTDQFVCTKAEQRYTLNKFKRRMKIWYDTAFNSRNCNNRVCCTQN